MPPRKKKRKLNDQSCDTDIITQFLKTSNKKLLEHVTDEDVLRKILSKCAALQKSVRNLLDESESSSDQESESSSDQESDQESDTDSSESDYIELISATEMQMYHYPHKFDKHGYELNGEFSLKDGSKINLSLTTHSAINGGDEYWGTLEYEHEIYEIKFDAFSSWFTLIQNSKIVKLAKRCNITIKKTNKACQEFVQTLLVKCVELMEQEYWNQKCCTINQLSEVLGGEGGIIELFEDPDRYPIEPYQPGQK
eukprot:191261_1